MCEYKNIHNNIIVVIVWSDESSSTWLSMSTCPQHVVFLRATSVCVCVCACVCQPPPQHCVNSKGVQVHTAPNTPSQTLDPSEASMEGLLWFRFLWRTTTQGAADEGRGVRLFCCPADLLTYTPVLHTRLQPTPAPAHTWGSLYLTSARVASLSTVLHADTYHTTRCSVLRQHTHTHTTVLFCTPTHTPLSTVLHANTRHLVLFCTYTTPLFCSIRQHNTYHTTHCSVLRQHITHTPHTVLLCTPTHNNTHILPGYTCIYQFNYISPTSPM